MKSTIHATQNPLSAEKLTDPQVLVAFLSVLTHDVKAPIRHMRMHLGDIRSVLKTQEGNPEAGGIQQALSNSDRSLNRLKRIADKLSEYHISLLPIQPDLVSLEEIFHEEQMKLKGLIDQTEATITIERLPSVMGDREQLSILINNIMENALLYHGSLAPQILVTAHNTNGQNQVMVRDNGQGITGQQLEHIFKPFTRLHSKDQIEGAGLGLWIARTIAENHYMTLILERNDTESNCSEKTQPSTQGQAHAAVESNPSQKTEGPNHGCRAILSWAP